MLLDLQRDFRRTLLDRPEPSLVDAVEGDGLAREARLRIYRNHVALSLREALRATFPVVSRLVGEEFFAGLARAFVSAHPPQSPCLFEYGQALTEFLATYAPASGLPYLADVARLEWAMNAAYNASLVAALDPPALAAIDPERLAGSFVVLQPSLRVVRSAFPVDDIWRANQPGRAGSGVDLDRGPVALLVWRQDDDAVFQSVDEAFATLVADLARGTTLGRALEGAIARAPQFDPGVALGRMLAWKLIAGIVAPAAS